MNLNRSSRPLASALAAALLAAIALLASSAIAPAAEAHTMVVQPDGKIVLGGYGYPGFAAMVRYGADGSLDQSFGKRGVVLDHRLQPVGFLALQPDGKLLSAAARMGSPWPPSQLGRYLPDGSPDTGFGAGGVTLSTSEPAVGAQPWGLLLRADGTILAGFNHCCVKYSPSSSSIEAFSPTGAYLGGSANLPGQPLNAPGEGASLADMLALPDGSLVGVGYVTKGGAGKPFKSGFGLVRVAPGSGTYDRSFGEGEGMVVGGLGAATAAALDEGKILVAGYSGYGLSAGGQALLTRYSDAGVLDTGFGSAGFAQLPLAGSAYSQLNAVTVAPNGSIYAVGTSFTGFDPDFSYVACDACTRAVVAKFTPAGALDPSFGEGGVVKLGGGAVPAMSGDDLALLGDGRILVSGAGEGDSRPFVLARLTADGQLDPSFGDRGVVSTTACPGSERQRRARGCLPSARIGLQVGNLAGPKPRLRLRVDPNVGWARIRSVQLVLPRALRLHQARVENNAGFTASVPGRKVVVKPHPHSLNATSLGSARSFSATLWRHALSPVRPFPRGRKLSFRVVVRFGEPGRDEGEQTVVLRRRG
ncbi:MAG: hypothetical protein ACOYD4_15710 [Solirubrobacterales bacterium]